MPDYVSNLKMSPSSLSLPIISQFLEYSVTSLETARLQNLLVSIQVDWGLDCCQVGDNLTITALTHETSQYNSFIIDKLDIPEGR